MHGIYIYVCMGMVFGCFRYLFFWGAPILFSMVWCLSTETAAAAMLKGQAKAKAKSATNPVKAKPHMNVPSPHRRVGVTKASSSTLGSNMHV